MWEIVPRLYLGTKGDAKNTELLHEAGVTHIVNCAAEVEGIPTNSFEYLQLGLNDPDYEFGAKLDSALAFIDGGREHGKVLVHCTGAISRSPATILAYLCHTGLTLDEAVQTMRKVTQTRPNGIFIRQICAYFKIHATDDDISMIIDRLGTRTKGEDDQGGA